MADVEPGSPDRGPGAPGGGVSGGGVSGGGVSGGGAPEAGGGAPARPATGFVDAWEQTDSLRALRRAVTAAGKVRPAVARRAGLGESELVALERLVAAPAGPAELARLLGVSTAAATGLGDRLEAHGHAERRAHPSDRRRVELHVTDSGREEVLAHLLPMFSVLARLDAGFTDDERAVVARYLDGAREAFEELAELD
ncbi:MarR family transcriptional regulator [Nocardioides sp. GY 10127]|uniref:MarR family winged helix-turn-helix transcriptional regulator n=1 Tax=Nocardioides sp. GY 10127 TaxID=2569762 RepID=UPI0010A8DDDE|nr:MarR family transcriptional regulator [Nocardioides sp. GY 10127]TIC82603.1 MarR family transcriptional regulator [Nocardioides sp. GY 10127]